MMSDDQCEVVFSYQGMGKEELTLQAGQVVDINTKELEDAGWWKGEVDGVVGVFPENFVKLIAKDDKGGTMTKNGKEKAKMLNNSFSVEEKYDLASLKKELSKTSIQRNQSQKDIKRSKGPSPRPQNDLPMSNPVNATDIREAFDEKKTSGKEMSIDESIFKPTYIQEWRVNSPSHHFLKEDVNVGEKKNIT